MRARITALVVMVLGVAGAVHGDGGMIPFTKDVRVYEPSQRAVIAWNGQEEILILSTDTYASTPTKGLEVIPLRTEPAVKKADPGIFAKATRLIESKLAERRRPIWPSPSGMAPGGAPLSAPSPAGEITLHERIGRHDIAVTHVLDEDGFSAWAEEHLRTQGVDTPAIPARIRIAIQGYLKKEFTWFVYDVIDLETTVRTNDPIQLCFKSDCVFYPLVITQTENRKVDIQVLLLTSRFLESYPELPRSNIRLLGQEGDTEQSIEDATVVLVRQQTQELSPDIDALFGEADGIKLRAWNLIPEQQMRGRFIHDLVAR